ncbi:amino acid ABC transporter substrate-binding protein [Haematospirillum jordaniae]|uniref:substrate-binding periplasmic protein n=1 Tax=Haematospirillum jordaniae TaxID=1549855 RepID=UPI0014329141|nr:transporter substrate-binding domain-containing protein [Haematospirillum jordaniae]NKD85909.1 amino acid ABC transporter substrate-binding protein [Haematospirillum jordaniae]
MKCFPALLATLLFCINAGPSAAQDPLSLVTGDYAPYSGENLPQGGLSTILVRAVFKAMDMPEPKMLWMPWKRGYEQAKSGEFPATFPYFKDSEREKDFLFSEPLHIYKRVFFARSQHIKALKGEWNSMRLCVPLGWTVEPFAEIIREYSMELQRPASLESCMRMLESSRTDLIVDDEIVVAHELKRTFGTTDGFSPSTHKQQEDRSYFLVSRAIKDSQKLHETFNEGLAKIRASGEYDKIVETYRREHLK